MRKRHGGCHAFLAFLSLFSGALRAIGQKRPLTITVKVYYYPLRCKRAGVTAVQVPGGDCEGDAPVVADGETAGLCPGDADGLTAGDVVGFAVGVIAGVPVGLTVALAFGVPIGLTVGDGLTLPFVLQPYSNAVNNTAAIAQEIIRLSIITSPFVALVLSRTRRSIIHKWQSELENAGHHSIINQSEISGLYNGVYYKQLY
ncbi:MAG: hypothetical protein GXY20_07290 [Clostridiales bacterium]|nr:hypothetical protein [Clostridiales bacterium]